MTPPSQALISGSLGSLLNKSVANCFSTGGFFDAGRPVVGTVNGWSGLLLTPWRWAKIKMPFWHRGAGSRANPTTDQSPNDDADGATDQADCRTRTGPGGSSATRSIFGRSTAATEADNR